MYIITPSKFPVMQSASYLNQSQWPLRIWGLDASIVHLPGIPSSCPLPGLTSQALLTPSSSSRQPFRPLCSLHPRLLLTDTPSQKQPIDVCPVTSPTLLSCHRLSPVCKRPVWAPLALGLFLTSPKPSKCTWHAQYRLENGCD